MFRKTMVGFMLVLILALSGGVAVEAAEDCLPFNPNTTTVSSINNDWKIVDGNHALFSFGTNQAEAREALAIIKHFRMNQSCFVGRPQPSFTYMLVSGRAPNGSMAGEHCVSFNPASATVAFVKNDWKIVDGDHWLLSFGSNQAEARESLAIIKKYNFNSSCFVGRPNPSFTYMKASGSAPISAVTGTAPVTGTLAANQPVQGTVAPAAADLRADRIWMARYVPPASLTQYTPMTGNPKAGEEVYLVCEFHNAGGDVKGDWRISWQVDGKEVYSTRFGDFKAGAKQNPAARYRVPDSGTHSYACVLDPDRRIAERDDANNSVAGTFQVTAAAPPAGTSAGTGSSGTSQNTAPVLTSLSTTAAVPGTSVSVAGQNFSAIGSWRAVIELQSGEKIEQAPQALNATQFKVNIPDIYAGYNVMAKNAQHRQRIQQLKQIYLKQGTKMSNKLGFNIASNYPIIDKLSKGLAYPGDVIVINGGNVDMARIAMYQAVFEYLPGKRLQAPIMPGPVASPSVPLPYLPNTSLVAIFQVIVPDVFAGKSPAEQDTIARNMGKLYIFGPTGPAAASNPINIQILKKAAAQPGSATGSTTPAATCPGGRQFPGYVFVGQPSCAGVMGSYLRCDTKGYFCCASSSGSQSPRCGSGKYEFQPGCTAYSSGGGSNVGPLLRDGIFYGCYRTTP